MVLALYGSGAIGRDVKYYAQQVGKWSDIVFIDDINTGDLMGSPIYSYQDFKKAFKPDEATFLITVGELRFRRELFEKMKRSGYTGAILIHPNVFVAEDVELGEGAVLSPGVYVGSLVRIGVNFLASHNASIGHDAVIGDHVNIGAGAFIGGHIKIGDCVHIGSNSALTDRISIGSNSNIAPGAALFTDAPDNSSVVGNPARIVDENRQAFLFKPSAETVKKREDMSAGSVAEKYWDVFSDCFTGIDFNPVSFRFRDQGWDSIRQMSFAAKLEETFDISLKGREILKVNSYETGLNMVKKKLKEKEEG